MPGPSPDCPFRGVPDCLPANLKGKIREAKMLPLDCADKDCCNCARSGHVAFPIWGDPAKGVPILNLSGFLLPTTTVRRLETSRNGPGTNDVKVCYTLCVTRMKKRVPFTLADCSSSKPKG